MTSTEIRAVTTGDQRPEIEAMFRTTETTRAVLWLYENDAANWYVGSHAVIHEPTGIAIWTANKAYGMHLYYDVPTEDRKTAHPCNGRKVELKWLDRRALCRAVSGLTKFTDREIQRQISDWATDKIRNTRTRRAYVRS